MLCLSIMVHQQRHDQQQCFLKVSNGQASHLQLAQAESFVSLSMKINRPRTRDPEAPGQARIMCQRTEERI